MRTWQTRQPYCDPCKTLRLGMSAAQLGDIWSPLKEAQNKHSLHSKKCPPVRQPPLCRHKVCRRQFCPPECAWKQDSIVSLHMFDYQPDAELVSLQPLSMAKVGCVVAKQTIWRKRGGARGTQAPGIESISISCIVITLGIKLPLLHSRISLHQQLSWASHLGRPGTKGTPAGGRPAMELKY